MQIGYLLGSMGNMGMLTTGRLGLVSLLGLLSRAAAITDLDRVLILLILREAGAKPGRR